MNYPAYLQFAKRLFRKQGAMPLYFVFFITERCLAHCRHCLLGQKTLSRPESELRLDEIEKFSRGMGEIMFLLLTGGDPFLRADLPEIVRIFHRNNRVRNLGMPTNGSLPDQVPRAAEEILRTCPDLDFAIDISIDGIGADHDEIRQFPGLFEKAVETYRRLEELKRRYSHFNLNVAVTVSAYNQDRLEELYRDLRGRLGVATINQLLVRGKPREPEAGQVDVEKYLSFSRLLAEDEYRQELEGYGRFPFSDFVNAMKHVRQEVIARIVRQNRQQVPCYAGTLSAVLYANGDLFPCELLDEKLGNIREAGYDFRRLWFSPRADEIRRQIRATRCFCTYECFLTNSILFTPSQFPAVAREAARLKWRRAQAAVRRKLHLSSGAPRPPQAAAGKE